MSEIAPATIDLRLNIRRNAFSLVELLVVVAIIALMLAILLPALGKARQLARRSFCLGKLRQIAFAYTVYLGENDGTFYGDDPNIGNPNYTFGGWTGEAEMARFRPINKHLGLPTMDAGEREAAVFQCPEDRNLDRSRYASGSIYRYMGNSYQANSILVSPRFLQTRGKEPWVTINRKILKGDRANQLDVFQPSRLIWMGDSSWYTQWDPLSNACTGRHGRRHYHCVAFFDGHVNFVEIVRGLYDVTGGHRIQPHKEADKTILANQHRVPCSCESK